MRLISAERREEPRIQEDSSAQLHHAIAVKSEVLSTKKLSDSDRMVFAKNLGELYQEIERVDPSISFSKLFGDIFDEVTAEGLVKKRRTVIIFEGEETNSQGLRATPHHYVDIASGLARKLSTGEENAVALGMLKLIEGSSFDFQGAVRDKFTAQCEADLTQTLKHVVKSVRSAVDMDWLYEWSEDHPFRTSGLTGELIAIAEGHGSSYLNYQVEDDGNQQRNCCPCVPIASIEIPFSSAVKTLAIHCSELEASKIEVGNGDLTKFLINHLREQIPVDTAMAKAARDNFSDEGDFACWYLNQIPDVHFGYEDLGLAVQMRVDLELRYSRNLARWEAIILYREILKDGLVPEFDTLRTNRFSSDVQFIGWDAEDSDTQTFAVHDWFNETIFVFSVDLFDINLGLGLEDMPPGASDIGSSFNLTKNRADDLALRTDLKISSLLYEFDTHKYVPAPSNSIAKLILENMAYAPRESRLDTLMVKDALAKEKMIKGFAASLENEFRSAFAENVSRGS